MHLKHINKYPLNESEDDMKSDGITLSEDQIDYLNNKGVNLAVKVNKNIKGVGVLPCIENKRWRENSISISIDLRKLGISENIDKLEKYSDSDIIPKYPISENNIQFQYFLEPTLPSGSYKLDKYKFGINEHNKIKIRINFETIEDITKIINESIIEIFKDFKKVRIFINSELKKLPETSVDIKKEIKEIYDDLLDQFLESGKIKGDDLDENLRAILLGNALEKNNDEIEKFNLLPESTRKSLLSGWGEILKSTDLTISLRKIEALRKYISVKKSWDFI
jgi:hypothetical protein